MFKHYQQNDCRHQTDDLGHGEHGGHFKAEILCRQDFDAVNVSVKQRFDTAVTASISSLVLTVEVDHHQGCIAIVRDSPHPVSQVNMAWPRSSSTWPSSTSVRWLQLFFSFIELGPCCIKLFLLGIQLRLSSWPPACSACSAAASAHLASLKLLASGVQFFLAGLQLILAIGRSSRPVQLRTVRLDLIGCVKWVRYRRHDVVFFNLGPQLPNCLLLLTGKTFAILGANDDVGATA